MKGRGRPSPLRATVRVMRGEERHHHSPRVTKTLSAVILVIVLAACSSGSYGTSATTTTAVAGAGATQSAAASALTPPLEPAVRAYVAAFIGGDEATAFALLSDRCQKKVGENSFVLVVTQAHEQYGSATIVSYRDDVTGSTATATYDMSDPALNRSGPQPWVLENGAWRMDRCP